MTFQARNKAFSIDNGLLCILNGQWDSIQIVVLLFTKLTSSRIQFAKLWLDMARLHEKLTKR